MLQQFSAIARLKNRHGKKERIASEPMPNESFYSSKPRKHN